MKEIDLLPLEKPVSGPAANLALLRLDESDKIFDILDEEGQVIAARHVVGEIMNVRELTQLVVDQKRFERGTPKASSETIKLLNDYLDIAGQVVLSAGISFTK